MKKLLCMLIFCVTGVGAFAQYDGQGIAIGARAGVFAYEIGDSFSTGKADFGKNMLPNVGIKDSQIFTAKDKEKIKPAQMEAPNWAAFLLNFLVGVGIGSYAQGDIVGGVIGTVGEVGGIAMLCSGFVFAPRDSYGGIQSNAGTDVLMIGGAIILIGTRIFELVRPWTYD
jgi:hypothetical protein